MAATIKLGNKDWAAKKDSLLAYNDEDNNFKPLPFDFTRASSATYVGSDGFIKTSTTAQPRIDFTDNTDGHLLLEPTRTNIITYSEDFTQSFYIKDSGVSVDTTNNVSPSGESNATKIDVTDNGRIYANTTSGTYAPSVFIKAGTFSHFKFLGSNVDLVAETYSGGTIESFGNGWFRITKAYTGSRPFQVQAYPDGTYSSHTTSGNYFIWGAQVEAGAYATSYIPTSGSTATRAAETCTGSGNSQVINSTEGVLFVEMAALADNSSFRTISLSNGTNNECVRVRFRNSSNSVNGLIRDGGSAKANISHQVSDIKQFHKLAFKYKSGDCQFWVDGVKVGTSTDTFVLSTQTQLNFDQGTPTDIFYGKCKQLKVYNTVLKDSELKTLTT